MRIVSYKSEYWPPELLYNHYVQGDQLVDGFIVAMNELNLYESPESRNGHIADYFYDSSTGEDVGSINLYKERDDLRNLYYNSISRDNYISNVVDWLKFNLNIWLHYLKK